MNGYKAFYARKEIEVQAETSYVAQLKATEIFGLPKKRVTLSRFSFAKNKASKWSTFPIFKRIFSYRKFGRIYNNPQKIGMFP